jgi:hypothetical protein
MVYHGHIRNGQIVLDEQARLPEGAAVRVDVVSNGEAEERAGEESDPTLYERLKPIIGIIDDLPEDGSMNVDHYLYGHPKR